MFDIILKTEESKAAAVILLTWLVFMPMIIIKVFSEFAMWALAMFGVVVLSMLVIYLYSRRSRTFEGLAYDERTKNFSLKSSRNGFFMAIAAATLLAVCIWLGSQIGAFDAIMWVWAWATAAYMLSYLYYLWRGANIG
jgi:uncharacterized membrane protein